MRLLDTYALYCGAKIDKPFVYEGYFPLPFEKYITFQAETPYDSRNYSYWQDVLDMVIPILSKHGITVLQLGVAKEAPYQRVVDLRGQTNFHQLAYLIRRSMLHFGPDSFGVHLASSFNRPLVSLYSCSMPEVAGPHFGDKDKQILFKAYERVGNKKPSYSLQENPKSINTIKPEEVAAAILRLLNIDFKIPVETVFTGNRYSHQIVRELIPNSQHLLQFPDQPIELRVDVFYDEKLLAHHLNYWQKAVIVTDKPLSLNMLRHFKPHINMVIYHVTEKDDPKFAADVIQCGITLAIVSKLPDAIVQEKKIQYYEFGLINRVPIPDPAKVEELKKDISNLYYRSSKLIASNGALYASHADVKAGQKIVQDFEYRKVIDSPKFWEDLEYFTIVKKL